MGTADTSEQRAKQRRSLIFVFSACEGAISRLDPDDLYQLGLITRLQEIIELVERDLDRLTRPQ